MAKSCTTTADRWLFRESQPSLRILRSAVIKSPKFTARRYGSANTSSARGSCNFGPLTDLAISVLKEISINTVLTQNPHVSWVRALKMLHEKNWRESLHVQELYHPRDFLWNLAAIPVYQNTTSLTVLTRGLRFYLAFDSGLAWSMGRTIFPFNMFTWHRKWIEIYPTQVFPCIGPTVAWHSNCGWWRRRAWGWRRMINLLSLEELVDKRRNTIGRNFSVLHCIRYRFNEMSFFDRWSIRKSTRVHRKVIPAIKTAGVSSRTFIVKNIPNSLT